MNQRKPVHISDAAQQLLGKEPDVTAGERLKLVVLEKVEDAAVEQVKYNAYVVPKIKGLEKLDTLIPIEWVMLAQALQYANLDLTRVSVLLYCANHLDCDAATQLAIVTLDNLAERALTQ